MDLYAARINVHGTNRIDRIINEQQSNFEKYLSRTPNRKQFFIDGVGYYGSILLKKDEQNNTHLHLLAPFSVPLKTGTLLQWNNSYWIVLYEVEPKKTSSFNGVIKKCNHELKWIDKYGIERSTPCYISGYAGSDLQYKTSANGFGANSSFLFSSSNALLNVIVQANSETQILENEDRFVLNREAWILDNVDSISSNDLIYLQLKHVMRNKNDDDLDNSLANTDYLNSWSLKIVNGDEISLYPGDSVPIEVLLYELNDIVHTPVDLTWTVSDDSIIKLDGDTVKGLAAGEATLTVAISECEDVFDTLKIVVEESPQLNVYYSFDGDLTLKQGETKRYKVTKTVNGKVDELVKFKFKLEDPLKITYGLKRIDNSTVEIKAKTKVGTGHLKLIATDDLWTEVKDIYTESIFA